ncbi:hypothetical protein Gpo141_00010823 [Globisporangium polare]
MAPVPLHLHGQCSVERAFGLEEYARTTPSSWAILVCIVTVVPPLVGILVFDSVPLHDPSEGLEHNGMIFARLFGSAFLLTIGILLQLKSDVPAAAMTVTKCLFVSLFTAASYTASYFPVATYWVFPVPFGFFILTLPWCFFFITSVVFAIGIQNLREKPELQRQLNVFNRQMNVANCFLPIYLVYNAVFIRLSGSSRLAWVLLLPVIKIVLKRIVAKVTAGQVDRMPARVMSVDVFNALYQSKCMQTTGSTWVTVVIIAIDVVQNVYSIRRLMHQMKYIEELTGPTEVSLLNQVVQALADPDHLDSQSLLTVETRSCTRLSLNSDKMEMVERIEVAQTKARNRPSVSSRELISTRKISFIQVPALTDVHSIIKPQTSRPDFRVRASNQIVPILPEHAQHKRTRAILASLDLIWKCELLLLIEYVEAAIPLLYAIYFSVLYRLPNAKYYPGISEMSQKQADSAIASILLYAGLEIGSLVFVHVILKWKFNFSALHQLAFVLESDWALIQGVLVGWVVVVLQFTLMHYGIDFTFQFEWMRNHKSAP